MSDLSSSLSKHSVSLFICASLCRYGSSSSSFFFFCIFTSIRIASFTSSLSTFTRAEEHLFFLGHISFSLCFYRCCIEESVALLHDTLTRSHTPIFVLFFFLLVCFFFFFFCVDGAGTKKETHLIIRVTEPPRRLPAKVLASFHVQRFFFFASVSASLPFCHILLSFDQFLRVFFFWRIVAFISAQTRAFICVSAPYRELSELSFSAFFSCWFIALLRQVEKSTPISSSL